MEAPPAERRRPRQLPEGETAAEGEALLVAQLTPGRPQQHDWKSSCETWSVAFSPDGAWFAWSQGHCVVKLLPWPLQGTEHNRKALERKSQCAKTKLRGYGGSKEKTLECGQIVWGLAFSSWLPPQPHKNLRQEATPSCLILATGLNDGQIKVWEVQTGGLLFNLLGHQDVVRDLSFAPGKSCSILVSASRDKTLRVWDLGQNGKQLKVLSGHVQWVYCCSISPDGQMLCSAAGEKSACSVATCCGPWWQLPHQLPEVCVLLTRRPLPCHCGRRQAPPDLGIRTWESCCLCPCEEWSLLHLFSTWWDYRNRDQRWSRAVLDSSSRSVFSKALMSESPPWLLHKLPGSGTEHSKEDEGISHLQDFMMLAERRSRNFSLIVREALKELFFSNMAHKDGCQKLEENN